MKKWFFVSLVCLFVLSASAQERKKVGVVLSGGGAKGVAHVSVLKAIEEAGIPIDYIAGTSMGSIVGGLYAIGYTANQLDSMVRVQDWSFLLSDKTQRKMKTYNEREEEATYVLSVPLKKRSKGGIPDGIIKGQNLNNLFTNLTVGYHDSLDFNKLPIPFACVAVDLNKGKEVVFHSGKLAEAMRASMAIPAAFTPVRLDSMVLVDGGVVNNFPVDVVRKMGAEIVIGVDVQSEKDESHNVNTLLDIIGGISDMLADRKYIENRKGVDVYIQVDVKGYSAASFSTAAIDTLMRRGAEAADLKRSDLHAVKKKIGIADSFVPRAHGPFRGLSDKHPFFIHAISFGKIQGKEKQKLLDKCGLKENSDISRSDLQHAIDVLYKTQLYTNINYDISEENDAWNLDFIMEEVATNNANLGVRIDSEEIASLILNGSYQFRTQIPTKIVLTARFGKRTGGRLDYQVYLHPLHYFNLSYSFQYNDINIYKRGSREYNATYRYHTAEIGYSHIFNQYLKLGGGLSYEHYNYEDFLYGSDEAGQVDISPEGYFSYFARLNYNSTDRKTYPNRGAALQADFSLYTDNLATYDGGSPFAAASVWWKWICSTSRRFAIIPSAYGRILFGDVPPYPFMNAMGGDTPGRLVPQQLPFAGIAYMEPMDKSLAVVAVKFRGRIARNNYLFCTLNHAWSHNKTVDIFNGRKVIGGSIGYGYNSFLGPLEASLNLSDSTDKLGFYMNLGFVF